MTASRIEKTFKNRPLQALFQAGEQTPTREQKLFRLDGEPASALGRRISTLSDPAASGAVETQRWSAEWSGDQLIRLERNGEDDCKDQTGSLCPKFAEARARQTLAEHQLTEFNHRLVNILQMLASRIERQRRLQDVPARRHELERLVASIHASGQLNRYLLPPRSHRDVDLDSLLGNVATAIAVITGLVCHVEAETVSVPGQVAVHLAAAVNELAWNAHKHAYSGAAGGVIRIVCRHDDDDILRLSVADRGCGLPADFDPRESEGLGLMVVCSTTRQFSGTLRVESNRGAIFTMLLNTKTFEAEA